MSFAHDPQSQEGDPRPRNRFGFTDYAELQIIEAPLVAKLKAESFLIDLSAPAFTLRAAFFLGEIDAIHPFREGNGRTQREFIRQLALHVGHPLLRPVSPRPRW